MIYIVSNRFIDDIQFKALIPRQGNHLIRDFSHNYYNYDKEFQPFLVVKFNYPIAFATTIECNPRNRSSVQCSSH